MLHELSKQIADIVARVAPSVVQVEGSVRPASGLVYAEETVLTTARAVGRSEHPRVRRADGSVVDAEIGGWDPATRLVALKAPGLTLPALSPGALPAVGEIAIAVARSWSNVVTACSSCNTRKGNHLPEECGMHPHTPPREPHFVHLSWAVRRLSVQQAKYIKLFYGEEALRALGGVAGIVARA